MNAAKIVNIYVDIENVGPYCIPEILEYLENNGYIISKKSIYMSENFKVGPQLKDFLKENGFRRQVSWDTATNSADAIMGTEIIFDSMFSKASHFAIVSSDNDFELFVQTCRTNRKYCIGFGVNHEESHYASVFNEFMPIKFEKKIESSESEFIDFVVHVIKSSYANEWVDLGMVKEDVQKIVNSNKCYSNFKQYFKKKKTLTKLLRKNSPLVFIFHEKYSKIRLKQY